MYWKKIMGSQFKIGKMKTILMQRGGTVILRTKILTQKFQSFQGRDQSYDQAIVLYFQLSLIICQESTKLGPRYFSYSAFLWTFKECRSFEVVLEGIGGSKRKKRVSGENGKEQTQKWKERWNQSNCLERNKIQKCYKFSYKILSKYVMGDKIKFFTYYVLKVV